MDELISTLNKEIDWMRTINTPNEIRVYSEYCEMDLYDRYSILVDKTEFDVVDLNLVVGTKWRRIVTYNNKYVQGGSSTSKLVLLHRVLLGAKDDEQVDHINGDGLNNRRSNLRIVTPSQQQWNSTRAVSNTGIKGVCLMDTRTQGSKRPYRAQVRCNYKQHFKYFASLKEATVWVRETRERLHGEYAKHT